VAAAALAAFLCSDRAAAENLSTASASRLFGTVEYASGDLRTFRKWRRALVSSAEELSRCRAGGCDERWRAIVDGARGYALMQQLQEINRRVNSKPYVPDVQNWGSRDYWATPLEFLRKGGDCEDYAITKYMTLRHLGVSPQDMRIVVLRDQDASTEHVVLAVYIDGIPYILDNRTAAITSSISIASYRPIYSINEHGWWLHRDTRRAVVVASAREHVMSAREDGEATMTASPAARDIDSGRAAGKEVAVQVASFSRNIDAGKAILEYRERYHDVIPAEDLEVARTDLGDRGVWYRVLIGPFAAHDAAIDLCRRLRGMHISSDCFVTAMP
jgi:predicted transglutaminase-like cysteine proteinase